MSLASGISAGFTAIATAVKALTGRVTTLESRTSVVVLTQAQYDALSPPASTTLYVIVG